MSVNVINKYNNFEVTVNFTRPSTTTVYTKNDAISNSLTAPTPISIPDMSEDNGGFSIITDVTIDIQSSSGTPSIDLWLFQGEPTATNDNDDMSVSNDDLNSVQTVISLSEIHDAGTQYILHKTNANDRVKCGSNTTHLYGLLQSKVAFTPVSGDVVSVKIIGEYV